MGDQFAGEPVDQHQPASIAVEGFDLGKDKIDLLARQRGDALGLGHQFGMGHGAFVSGAGRR